MKRQVNFSNKLRDSGFDGQIFFPNVSKLHFCFRNFYEHKMATGLKRQTSVNVNDFIQQSVQEQSHDDEDAIYSGMNHLSLELTNQNLKSDDHATIARVSHLRAISMGGGGVRAAAFVAGEFKFV